MQSSAASRPLRAVHSSVSAVAMDGWGSRDGGGGGGDREGVGDVDEEVEREGEREGRESTDLDASRAE